jgi:hypothetical protein
METIYTFITHPLTYILGLAILFAYFEIKSGCCKNKCCSPTSTEANKSSKPKRARSKKGKFLADDPSTPQNEAWEGGKAPKKKAAKKKTTRKRAPRKSGS